MTRRRLLTLLALVAAALAAGAVRLFRLRGKPVATRGPQEVGGVAFAADDLAVLLAVADVIVPREGSAPAASEIDLLASLAILLNAAPLRSRAYSEHLPTFASTVRARVPFRDGRPEPELLGRLCERWHRELREDSRPGIEAVFFEQLRRDVLRAYYASPAGWASVGFDGPVHWSAQQLAAVPSS